jgi:K+-sensing histidine kinase KdpD
VPKISERGRPLQHNRSRAKASGALSGLPRAGLVGSIRSIALALALVTIATSALLLFSETLVSPSVVPLIYMVPVILAATRWGTLAGLTAAIAGAAAADFFFYAPVYSFWLERGQDAVHLLVYLLVSIVVSNLAARLKIEAVASNRREKEIKELHGFSQGLATCLTGHELIFALQDHISDTLGYRAMLLSSGEGQSALDADISSVPNEIRHEADKLILQGARQGSIVAELHRRQSWLVKTIVPEILGYGAIAVALGHGSNATLRETAHRVEAMLEEATAALKHLKAKEAVDQATVNYQTRIMRDALVGGVSHELRTPIASILGSCSVLIQKRTILEDRESAGLIEAIEDQVSRLDKHIRDLLDATRINAHGVHPLFQWTDPTDIVAAALKHKQQRLAGHSVVIDVESEPPLVQVDTVLVEQALGQLLENAAKYSPAGTPITIRCRRDQDVLRLSVTDRGDGLTTEDKSEIGKRCYRSARNSSAPGSGLGLWIANTFIVANGGSLVAESDGAGLGTTVSLQLPIMPQESVEAANA